MGKIQLEDIQEHTNHAEKVLKDNLKKLHPNRRYKLINLNEL